MTIEELKTALSITELPTGVDTDFLSTLPDLGKLRYVNHLIKLES